MHVNNLNYVVKFIILIKANTLLLSSEYGVTNSAYMRIYMVL